MRQKLSDHQEEKERRKSYSGQLQNAEDRSKKFELRKLRYLGGINGGLSKGDCEISLSISLKPAGGGALAKAAIGLPAACTGPMGRVL